MRTTLALTLAALGAPALAQTTATWINPAGGSFGNPANWSTNAVPGPQDTARVDLPGTYTITLDADRAIDTLIIAAGQPTLDLDTRTLTTRIRQDAGLARITNGTTRGRLDMNGGNLVIEPSAACRSALLTQTGAGIYLTGTSQLTVRGLLSHTFPGDYGHLTVDPAASIRIENNATVNAYYVNVYGVMQLLGGNLYYDTLDTYGFIVAEGGTIGGTLQVSLRHGTRLTVGERIPLITRGNSPISGAFDEVIIPSGNDIPGYVLQLSITPDEVALDVLGAPCVIDFNHDGDHATDQDIEDFFACLGGRCCPTCSSADFNGDGDTGTDQDIEAFFRVLGGGNC
ncbi:MAG TPA: hypothetical protein VD997_07455 [Phycisphaerales bacterium]|nr:hypothetical protein [Phycisphaerales bacterium]